MANLVGDSANRAVPAVKGTHTNGGVGVHGESNSYQGVLGTSQTNAGVVGYATQFHGVFGRSDGRNNAGVFGYNSSGQGAGVRGDGPTGQTRGVEGWSENWQGVYGHSQRNAGVVGEAPQFHAIYGISHSRNNGGVFGTNDSGGFGVIGRVLAGVGVAGHCEGTNGVGILGIGSRAARFEGNVEVTGDIRLLNADCAEEFDIAEAELVEPGTVMVLGEEGALHPSHQAYDKRVAGIVSGAGDYQPALVLDRQPERANRQPIALMGKVFCKVDAGFGEIEIGDLLTTSPTPGHAMKAEDPLKAFGAVIGKALRPFRDGQGLIPILVALQ